MRQIIIIFIGLISLIGLWDVVSQGVYFLHARQEVKNLKSQLHAKTASITPRKIQFMVNKDNVMASFFSVAEYAGLQVQSTSIFQNENVIIETSLAGNFIQMQQLLKNISKLCLPFVVKQIHIEKYANQLKLRLQLIFFKKCIRPTPNFNFTEQIADPFITNITQADEAILQNYPIKQFKLVGFWQGHPQNSAIVSLPNGNAHEIWVGDFLGRERAQLIAVQQKKMILQLNGKEIQIQAR